jgi:hypothetical protein
VVVEEDAPFAVDFGGPQGTSPDALPDRFFTRGEHLGCSSDGQAIVRGLYGALYGVLEVVLVGRSITITTGVTCRRAAAYSMP